MGWVPVAATAEGARCARCVSQCQYNRTITFSTMRAGAVRARNEQSILPLRHPVFLGVQLLRVLGLDGVLPEVLVLVLQLVIEFFVILLSS